MSMQLERFETVFNQLNADDLRLLEDIYKPDVAFQDPVRQLQGPLDTVKPGIKQRL